VNATSASASGTVRIIITGEDGQVDRPQWTGTLTWHGENVALAMPAEKATDVQLPRVGDQELRYVDGRFYYTTGSDASAYPQELGSSPDAPDGADQRVWNHSDAVDQRVGGATAGGDSALDWLIAARDSLDRGDLLKIMDGVVDLESTESADGATVYSGRTTAGTIMRVNVGVIGLPQTDRPLVKVDDPGVPVTVSLTVRGDGLIAGVHLEYSVAGFDWTYSSEYSRVGSTPAIAAPARALVIERDKPFM
jgi:hypothetical protein